MYQIGGERADSVRGHWNGYFANYHGYLENNAGYVLEANLYINIFALEFS